MPVLKVYLFGKSAIHIHDRPVEVFEARKLLEFFSYLLLFPTRQHSREALAALFWGDSTTAQSRKNLRQVIWQLQSVLNPLFSQQPLLTATPEWVRLDRMQALWLDVDELEQAYAGTQQRPGREMDAQAFEALEHAVDLYRGDLLEDCYHDWCLFERDRLHNIYLSALDKLMDYCEAHGRYESGLAFGERILRCDWAHERTHRRVMRLYALSGDRTSALRQFERCKTLLREELSAGPAQVTLDLYASILAGQFETHPAQAGEAASPQPVPVTGAPSLSDLLDNLKQLKACLSLVQQQVQQNIQAVERVLARSKGEE